MPRARFLGKFDWNEIAGLAGPFDGINQEPGTLRSWLIPAVR